MQLYASKLLNFTCFFFYLFFVFSEDARGFLFRVPYVELNVKL